MASPSQFSITPGAQVQGVSINQNRRLFNFGERVAELNPTQSPFFVYLSKVAKKATDDPVFKFLEQRHQWQRRNFEVKTICTTTAAAEAKLSDFAPADTNELTLCVKYDKYGRTTTVDTDPEFLIKGQTIVVGASADFTGTDDPKTDVRVTMKISKVESGGAIEADVLSIVKASDGSNLTAADFTDSEGHVIYNDGDVGQVIGSAWAEGTEDPDGWKDELYDREGYCQIFKTAIPMFSGTAMATHYRGYSDEYKRVWAEKLMEHKMDIEHAMLYGIGASDEEGSGPLRYSWGIIPYTEQFGKVKSFEYSSSTYDDFLVAMEDIFSPESGNSGNKLVLCSRKVLTWLNKLQVGHSFLGNTGASGHQKTTSGGSNAYGIDIQNVKGAFGHSVTTVNTIYGNLHFVQEPLLRGLYDDTAVMVDLKNVNYRPLVGNGVSRDTHIITNVQNNNVDGRKDIIMTEAGLEIQLPETHCILQFS